MGETTIGRRKELLRVTAKWQGLADAYTATLERVKPQTGAKSRPAMQALVWVSYL